MDKDALIGYVGWPWDDRIELPKEDMFTTC